MKKFIFFQLMLAFALCNIQVLYASAKKSKTAQKLRSKLQHQERIGRQADEILKDTQIPTAVKAIAFGDPAILEHELKNGFDANYINSEGQSLLEFALEAEIVAKAQRLTKDELKNYKKNVELIKEFQARNPQKIATATAAAVQTKKPEQAAATPAAAAAQQHKDKGEDPAAVKTAVECQPHQKNEKAVHTEVSSSDKKEAAEAQPIEQIQVREFILENSILFRKFLGKQSKCVENFVVLNSQYALMDFMEIFKIRGKSHIDAINILNLIQAWHPVILPYLLPGLVQMKLFPSNAIKKDVAGREDADPLEVDKYMKRIFEHIPKYENVAQIQQQIIRKIRLQVPKPILTQISEFMKNLDKFGQAQLLSAADAAQLQTVAENVEKFKFDPKKTQELLKHAINYNPESFKPLLQQLKELNAINARDVFGVPLLLYAALYSNPPETKKKPGTSVKERIPCLVDLFMEYGADPNIRDAQGRIALILTINDEVKSLLKAYGANINHVDADGRTALHTACQAGAADVVQALLAQGINLTVIDKNGNTAYQLAKDPEVLELLEKAGAQDFEKSRQSELQAHAQAQTDAHARELKRAAESVEKANKTLAKKKAKRDKRAANRQKELDAISVQIKQKRIGTIVSQFGKKLLDKARAKKEREKQIREQSTKIQLMELMLCQKAAVYASELVQKHLDLSPHCQQGTLCQLETNLICAAMRILNVICKDLNDADAMLKRILSTPQYVTFFAPFFTQIRFTPGFIPIPCSDFNSNMHNLCQKALDQRNKLTDNYLILDKLYACIQADDIKTFEHLIKNHSQLVTRESLMICAKLNERDNFVKHINELKEQHRKKHSVKNTVIHMNAAAAAKK